MPAPLLQHAPHWHRYVSQLAPRPQPALRCMRKWKASLQSRRPSGANQEGVAAWPQPPTPISARTVAGGPPESCARQLRGGTDSP